MESVGASSSRSPSASRRISWGLQALGAKLSRTLSHDRHRDDKDADSRSISTVGSKGADNADRSVSRGREVYQSSGRGGAGNIRRASISRDARPTDGPDDFSITRGREPVPGVRATFSTGRGGAGNIRSPSRDPADILLEGDTGLSDAEVIRAHVTATADVPHSSGRGGAGNIFPSRSHSRSRSRGPTALTSPTHSTGTPPRRGGAGVGVTDGHGVTVPEEIAEDEEDEERMRTRRELKVPEPARIRGGVGTTNLNRNTTTPERVMSTGRGGAGNRINK